MKKNYFMLAFASLMMAACANNDLVDEGVVKEEVPQAIGFDAFTNKTTRAEITNDAALKVAKFRVWGYKGDKSGNAIDWETQQDVFGEDGTVVGFSSDTWKPEDTKYWDKMTKYNFYAAAPAEPTNGATYAIQDDMDEENPGFITISNVQSGKSADSNDFLIARGGNEGVDGNYTGTHSAVNLAFHHTMAKLSFKLVAGISENITVTSLIMTGWDKGVGKFTQKSIATPNVLETSEWNIASTIDGEAILVGEGAGNETVNLPSGKTAVTLADTYIMVPQNIDENKLTFTINYEIGGEKYTAHVGTLTGAQVWGTDSHTTYTITVGPAEITFNVSVCNWDANKPTPGIGIE